MPGQSASGQRPVNHSRLSCPGSMVHATLGIRVQPGVCAGGRIPTVACGMIRPWRQDEKKWLTEARVAGRPHLLESRYFSRSALRVTLEGDPVGSSEVATWWA